MTYMTSCDELEIKKKFNGYYKDRKKKLKKGATKNNIQIYLFHTN